MAGLNQAVVGRANHPVNPSAKARWHVYVRGFFVSVAVILVLRDAGSLMSGLGFGRDAIGYWNAGTHILSGQPLYFDEGPPFGSEVFLFAPWFAWVWAPLTLLPRDWVLASWTVLMCIATVWAVAPVARLGLGGTALACILGYCLARGALWGNVMPLLTGALIHTQRRPSFPIWVGLAASLKILPILYVWPDVSNRRWRRVGLAIGLALVLWAPAALYGLADYPRGYSPTLSLLQVSGWLWGLVAVGALLLMFKERRSKWTWLTVTVAILAIYPRLHLHYTGLLGVNPRLMGRQD